MTEREDAPDRLGRPGPVLPPEPGVFAQLRRMLEPLVELIDRIGGSLDVSPTRLVGHAAVWMAAGGVGVAAVLYARLVARVQEEYFSQFARHPVVVTLAGPPLFVLAAWLVHRFGPDAKGSGIPQVLVAMKEAPNVQEGAAWNSSLVSLRTAAVKVVSSCVGILGGASIGREGPTVQIAAAGFAWIGARLRRFAPQIEMRTFLSAGAAAGVAAAFNTPLAGLTFALEEIGGDLFGAFRQAVMLAIIVSGVVAQGLSGNYLYFGRIPAGNVSMTEFVVEALLIGTVGGVIGAGFARFLAGPPWMRLPKRWMLRAFAAGVLCSAIGFLALGDTAGSGYEVTRRVLEGGSLERVNLSFPVLKLATTVLSYQSGMAGGIFSPSLAIGAGVGLSLAKVIGFANFKACALLGMVAFFSGAVRAPLTAVIIVMEMTDEHLLVIPFMIAAFLAYSAGRRVMAEPLYHTLARRYREA